MTSVNQPPSTKKTSISNAERLEGLEKAREKSSQIGCTISFLDFSEETHEIDSDGDRTDASITKDQVRGIFLTVESVILELKEIKRLVLELAADEDESCEIVEMRYISAMIVSPTIKFSFVRYGLMVFSTH
ncbi:MAG: hypothetical protein IPH22_08960 [Nitrosomonas sp.]|nr:hypothetical protein [Nitrosomonas sp.]